jgi:hypothetical protein
VTEIIEKKYPDVEPVTFAVKVKGFAPVAIKKAALIFNPTSKAENAV